MNAKFSFLNKLLLFSSNSTVSSVEILQMSRSIEFPLRFIRLDDHKLGRVYFEYFRIYLFDYLKNKNILNFSTSLFRTSPFLSNIFVKFKKN